MNAENIIPLRERQQMTINKSSWAWSTHVGAASIKAVLVALAECANSKTLLAFPSVAHLCEMTEINRKTVITGLSALVEMGLIEDTGSKTGATLQIVVYRLLVGNSPKNGTVKTHGNSTKSGTVPKVEQYQNVAETVPLLREKVPLLRGNSTKSGTRIPDISLSIPEVSLIHTRNQQPATHEPKADNAAKAAGVSVQQVVDLYHEVLPSLPSVLKLTDARRKAISARIRDDLQTVGQWQAYFEQVGRSGFLTGDSGTFRADLEWLCKPANFIKVREGKYDRKHQAASATQSKHNGFAQRDYNKGINPDGSF